MNMRLGLFAISMLSLALVACQKTEFQFGQPDTTPVMHDNLGNTRENMQLEPLAPISSNTENLDKVAAPAVQRVVSKPQPKINNNAPNVAIAPAPIEQPVTLPLPSSNPNVATSNWQPNEALLIRSNELISGLHKELGKKPTTAQMQQRLQTHMGLNPVQAQTIIAALGM